MDGALHDFCPFTFPMAEVFIFHDNVEENKMKISSKLEVEHRRHSS